MLTTTALAAIRFYQTVLSPYKGFRCAHAACRGGASCSTLGYRAIRRFGVLKGITVLQWRFEECGEAYRSAPPSRPMALGQQRGECDCGGGDSSCDGFDWCDLGDCSSSKKSRRQRPEKKRPGR